jgi:cell division protein FtsZ
MDELDPSIDVIWGMATDDTLDEDAKITILATGFENTLPIRKREDDDMSMDEIINEIYGERKKKTSMTSQTAPHPSQRDTLSPKGEGDVTNESPNEMPEDEEVQKMPDNSESPEMPDSPEKPLDPSRAFFNRVKKRFLQGLSSLSKEED